MDSWTEQAARLREMQRDVRKAYENGEIDVVQMTKLRLQIADRQHTHALSRPKDKGDQETTTAAVRYAAGQQIMKVAKERNQARRDRDKAQDEAKHYRKLAADEKAHREDAEAALDEARERSMRDDERVAELERQRDRVTRQRDELVTAAEEIPCACACTSSAHARRLAGRIRDGYVNLKWSKGL